MSQISWIGTAGRADSFPPGYPSTHTRNKILKHRALLEVMLSSQHSHLEARLPSLALYLYTVQIYCL